ncbi:MAG TPA: MFS transporter [Bryobacteraceae bacterium]|nr:MFS transporter [Bryobacteraceae bacterium]
MQPNPISLRSYWRLVRGNANFRRLWGAQVISELGDWFYTLAVYGLLLEITGSAAAVGLAVVLQLLPMTFAGPTAGVVNDRVSRRRVMIWADIARALIVLFMLLARSPSTIWMVYPLLFAESVMVAFFEPARNAVVPNITSPEELMVANTLSSTTWSFNLAIGAMLGGVVAALAGRDAVFVLNALSFLGSAALIRRMCFPEPHTEGAPPLLARDLVDFSPILDGIRYVRSDRRVLVTVFVKFGLGLMGSNNVILPILGERVFPVRLEGLSPERGAMLGMSLLMGARGAGSLLGPFVAGMWSGQNEGRLRLGILGGFLLAAAGYMALGFSPYAWAAIAAVVFAHAGSSAVWVFSTTLLQIYTEDRFRGRVFAADVGLLTLTISLSSYLAGALVDWGLPARVFASATGLLMLVPALAWALALRTKAGGTSG